MENLARRNFLKNLGRAACVATLGGVAYRVFSCQEGENFVRPRDRFVWAIDVEKCTYCGKCETVCVRSPSAVKAFNDQKKCSNCVVCYGYNVDANLPLEKLQDGVQVCPQNALTRTLKCGGLDGFYFYEVDRDKCNACGKCALACNLNGTKSMFMAISPDLCLECNVCAIKNACEPNAIIRVPLDSLIAVKDYTSLEGMEEVQ